MSEGIDTEAILNKIEALDSQETQEEQAPEPVFCPRCGFNQTDNEIVIKEEDKKV